MLVLIVNSTIAFAQVIDGPIALNHLKRQVRDKLYQERFDELEKMAHDFRSTKARFPHGTWKLSCFYSTFETPKNDTPDGWKRFLSKFDKWLAKYPDSVTARTAAAHGWEWFGWHARGIGFADKVTEEGWRLFHERISKAYSFVSVKPKKYSEDCPGRYREILALATYLGFDRAHFEALFNESISFQQDYHYYYFAKAHYLLPRWHGEDGETLRFALETTKLPPEKGGKTLYMDIVMTYWGYEFKSFDEDGVSRELIKQAIIETRREYPSSPYVLNYSCLYACLVGDREMARALFKEIGDHPYIEAWSDLFRLSEFKKWRDWALGNNKNEDKSEKLSFPGGTEDFRQMMLLAKDGDPEAQYKIGSLYRQGELVVQDENEAAKWYLKAAEQGHPGAQDSLGDLYSSGPNLPASRFEKAARWYYIAALQGNSNAASALGRMFYNEMGVYGTEKNLIKAYAWYSQVTQWKEPRVNEIAAKLTPEQLKQAEQEVNRLKEEIRFNTEAAETRPIDPYKINVPKMTFHVVPIEISTVPPVKLPTGNLLDGVKWQLSGEAQADGKILSIKNGGKLEAIIKTDPIHDGCILVGARFQHSRSLATVGGAPYFLGNLVDRDRDSTRIGMRLLVPPTVKEKNGPWFQVQPIQRTRFDAIRIRFGTAGTQEEEKKGSSTDFSDIRVMIFPTCDEAKTFGERLYKP